MNKMLKTAVVLSAMAICLNKSSANDLEKKYGESSQTSSRFQLEPVADAETTVRDEDVIYGTLTIESQARFTLKNPTILYGTIHVMLGGSLEGRNFLRVVNGSSITDDNILQDLPISQDQYIR